MTCDFGESLQVCLIQVLKARVLKLCKGALNICISSRVYKRIFISTARGVFQPPPPLRVATFVRTPACDRVQAGADMALQ